MKKYRLTYYPWITQNRSPSEIHNDICAFAHSLSEVLGASGSVTVLPALEVDKQIENLLAGDSEISLMNPLGYVFAKRRPNSQSISSAAIALRIIDGQLGDKYFAQIYANKTCALRPGDPFLASRLRGRSIGYGVPYSTSNFLVNAWTLKKKLGVHPFTFFSRISFLGGHDIVARAVYDRQVDIGAGHDGVILDLSNQYGYGDAGERLIQILRSDPIPSDPVVVRSTDPEEVRTLQDALVAAARTEEGKLALAGFWGNAQGLKAIDASTYDILNSVLSDLNLSETDLLRPSL